MRGAAWILAAVMLMLGDLPARGADESALFVVQYVDVAPSVQRAAAASLRQARALGRKEDGNLRFEVYAEAGRPSRFAIASLWRDQKAFEAHASSAGMQQLRAALDPIRVTAIDERQLSLLAGDPLGAVSGRVAAGASALYVVTHMDSLPTFKDEAAAALKQLAAASAKDAGLVRYQVLVQTNRANHFELLEVWKDRASFDAHVTAPHTTQFRDAVQQGAGSPYDERVYKSLE
jgi:quinol monooxygenase YgiN